MPAFDHFEEEVKGLRSILSVAQVVVSSLELDEVLQNILCSAMGIMDMPAGSIALYDETTRKLTLHVHAGLSPAFTARNCWRVKEGGLTHRILAEGELFIITDTSEAGFFTNSLALAEGIRALIAVPLQIQEKIVGILYLNDFVPRQFPDGRLQLLSILGSFATMSIDHARLHQRTLHLACTDGLTGLYNFRQFKKMLKEEMSRTKRYEKPLSLIMLDVDDFKRFNDTYGHPAGDRVLMTVAGILRDISRESDLVFRYGGEEFVAILPETDIERALVAAERIRRAIETDSASHMGEEVTSGVTVSLGVASFPRDGEDAEDLLEVVDNLLYRAKEQGKNTVYTCPSE
jgi:diguanylate cyclase (GGDEF)-like protein